MNRQSWLLVFDYSKVTVYDENDREVVSYPATSGRYHSDDTPGATISDQDRENLGPIPHGQYLLRPDQFSDAGPGRRLLQWLRDRNVRSPVTLNLGPLHLKKGELLGADWGETRVSLQSIGSSSREGFFLHGGHFAGSLGCIDVGIHDVELKQLLQDQGRTVHVLVDYTPGKILVQDIQKARLEHRAMVGFAPPPSSLRSFATASGFFPTLPPVPSAQPPSHRETPEITPTTTPSRTPTSAGPAWNSANDAQWQSLLAEQQKQRERDAQRLIAEARRRQEFEEHQRKWREDIERQQKALRERQRAEQQRTDDERRRREEEARQRERQQREERQRQQQAAQIRQTQIEAGERARQREERQRQERQERQAQQERDAAQRQRDREQKALDAKQQQAAAEQAKREAAARALNEQRIKDEKVRRDSGISIRLH